MCAQAGEVDLRGNDAADIGLGMEGQTEPGAGQHRNVVGTIAGRQGSTKLHTAL